MDPNLIWILLAAVAAVLVSTLIAVVAVRRRRALAAGRVPEIEEADGGTVTVEAPAAEPKTAAGPAPGTAVITPELEKIYTRRVAHDPADLFAAQRLAADTDVIRLGVFFRDETRPTDPRRPPVRRTSAYPPG